MNTIDRTIIHEMRKVLGDHQTSLENAAEQARKAAEDMERPDYSIYHHLNAAAREVKTARKELLKALKYDSII